MVVERVDDVWIIDAPWLDSPVTGATFEAVYWLAVAERHARTQVSR
jgi:hypothetical protein